MTAVPAKIKTFDLQPGRKISAKYEIIECLGKGWEGEVYKILEKSTNIERTAKLFFPHRNIKNKAINFYAKKLHKLRDCRSVVHYHHQETIIIKRQPIAVLISEYVKGELLSKYLESMPGRRLRVFQALHLLHSLVCVIESIHSQLEYHGDIHSDNIIVKRHGLSYELKILDFFHWGRPTKQHRRDDIVNAVQIFYDALGGRRFYSKQPVQVKQICCGLKPSLIGKKFPDISRLRIFIEMLDW
ncbi:MAG: protein kinase family protein [Candidatus Omnitrophica bacterium]|nr:protein kinase family protein [Candidatus Omnitrophota bacterium]